MAIVTGMTRAPRILLGLAAALSLVGGALHALAFRKALAAFDASNLPRFYASSSKGLWLADSATLIILAVIFAVLAWRPGAASRTMMLLVALIPAGTAGMIYAFVGGFFAGHMLVVIALLVMAAGVMSPAS